MRDNISELLSSRKSCTKGDKERISRELDELAEQIPFGVAWVLDFASLMKDPTSALEHLDTEGNVEDRTGMIGVLGALERFYMDGALGLVTTLLPELEDLRDQRIPDPGDVMVEAKLEDGQNARDQFQERLRTSYAQLLKDCLNELQAANITHIFSLSLKHTLKHTSTHTNARVHACTQPTHTHDAHTHARTGAAAKSPKLPLEGRQSANAWHWQDEHSNCRYFVEKRRR
jgi:hypothetical protein